MYTHLLIVPRSSRLRVDGNPIIDAFMALGKIAHIPSPLGLMSLTKRQRNGRKGAGSRMAQKFVRLKT